jgi:putative Ca2+/H+ antiporter (TMEM165/GDT1 family)
VLIAITLATGIVHLFSVALGGVIGTALPTKLISIVGAIAFVGFGIWTLRGDELTEKGQREHQGLVEEHHHCCWHRVLFGRTWRQDNARNCHSCNY